MRQCEKSLVLHSFNGFQHCWNISAVRNALPVAGRRWPACSSTEALWKTLSTPYIGHIYGIYRGYLFGKKTETGFAVPFQASCTSNDYAREARNKSPCFKGQKSKNITKKTTTGWAGEENFTAWTSKWSYQKLKLPLSFQTKFKLLFTKSEIKKNPVVLHRAP